MDHTVAEVAPCRKKISFTYAAAEVDEAIESMYGELSGEVALKGFRKGRAPRGMLVRRFAKDVARDAAAKLVSGGLEKAMEESKLNPMSQPVLTPEKPVAAPGEPFTFEAEMDVRPEMA